jgi:archaellum component FlaC
MKKLINDMGRLDLEQLIEVLEELLAKSEKPAESKKDPEISELKERVEKIESMMYGSIDDIKKLDLEFSHRIDFEFDIRDELNSFGVEPTVKNVSKVASKMKEDLGKGKEEDIKAVVKLLFKKPAERKVVNPRKPAKKE